MTKRFSLLLGVVGVVLAAPACGSGADTSSQTKAIVRGTAAQTSAFKPVALESTVDQLVTEIEKTPDRSMNLGIVLKAMTQYWSPVVAGANRALGELKVTGDVVGDTTQDQTMVLSQQQALFQQRREGGYDGLGLAPVNDDMQSELDAAVDQGIPVVTIDSDLTASKRQLYVGTQNYQAGATAGQTLLNLLTGSQGTVILLGNDNSNWLDGYNRTQGAKDVLEKAGYTVTVRTTDWSDTGEAADVDYLKNAILTADPPVVGMAGMFSVAYRCAMAAESLGKTGTDIKIVAFDFDAKTVQYMQTGLIEATHAQRQYYMGYLVPYVLYGFKALGIEKTKTIIAPQMVDSVRFDTGLDVVPAAQIDAYNSYLDSLGVGGQ